MAVRRIGIVGLSQVGKTTLFRILTHAYTGSLGTGRWVAEVAVVHVPDARLDRLEEVFRRGKAVHATLEFIDTPGSLIDLARTGTQAATLRELDALAHVLQALEEGSTPAPGADGGSQRDLQSVELELLLSDLAVIEKRVERLEKDLKKQNSAALELELEVLRRARTALEAQTPLREMTWSPEEERAVRGFAFLSTKPVLYVLNVSEKDAGLIGSPEKLAARASFTGRPRTALTAVCGKLEAELAELGDREAAEFLESYGLKESAIARLARSSYALLGLVSFFTIGESECRAWTIRADTTAFEAAGEIHSDFQKGFVRAEVVDFDDLVAAGGLAEARTRGTLKIVGREYVLHDADVVYFRHTK